MLNFNINLNNLEPLKDFFKEVGYELSCEENIFIINNGIHNFYLNKESISELYKQLFIIKTNFYLINKFGIKIINRGNYFFLENTFNKKEIKILKFDNFHLIKTMHFIL